MRDHGGNGGNGNAGSRPVALGALLGDVARRAAPGRVDWETWCNAVGERIARRTEPAHLTDGVLTVSAATATWAQELSFLVPMIVERLRERGMRVHSLRFVVRPVVPREHQGPTKRAPRAPVALPEDLAARLANIEDDELREAITGAASHWLPYAKR